MITHVAIRKDGVLRRLPLREKGYAAYSITQNYFSYLAEAGKLREWVANTLKPADAISILVIRRENRRLFQRWFTVDTLAQPDRAYLLLALDEEGRGGDEDYEVVLGWQRRRLLGGGGGGRVNSRGGDGRP